MPRKNKRAVPGEFVAPREGVKKTRTSRTVPPRATGPPAQEMPSTTDFAPTAPRSLPVATPSVANVIVITTSSSSSSSSSSSATSQTPPPAVRTSSPVASRGPVRGPTLVLSPIDALSSQQIAIRWGPHSPLLKLAVVKKPALSRRTLSSEEGPIRRRVEAEPKKMAELLSEIAGLASSPLRGSTTSSSVRPATAATSTDVCPRVTPPPPPPPAAAEALVPAVSPTESVAEFELSTFADCPELLAELLSACSPTLEDLNRTLSACTPRRPLATPVRAPPPAPPPHGSSSNSNSNSVSGASGTRPPVLREVKCCLSSAFEDASSTTTPEGLEGLEGLEGGSEGDFWSEAADMLATQEMEGFGNGADTEPPSPSVQEKDVDWNESVFWNSAALRNEPFAESERYEQDAKALHTREHRFQFRRRTGRTRDDGCLPVNPSASTIATNEAGFDTCSNAENPFPHAGQNRELNPDFLTNQDPGEITDEFDLLMSQVNEEDLLEI